MIERRAGVTSERGSVLPRVVGGVGLVALALLMGGCNEGTGGSADKSAVPEITCPGGNPITLKGNSGASFAVAAGGKRFNLVTQISGPSINDPSGYRITAHNVQFGVKTTVFTIDPTDSRAASVTAIQAPTVNGNTVISCATLQ